MFYWLKTQAELVAEIKKQKRENAQLRKKNTRLENEKQETYQKCLKLLKEKDECLDGLIDGTMVEVEKYADKIVYVRGIKNVGFVQQILPKREDL